MNWRRRHTVLGLATATFFTVLGARLLVSPVVPDIAETFSVTNAQIGLALTGLWAAYALLQFPSGVLGDKYGERALVLAALVVTSLGSVLLSVSPTFPLFAGAAVLVGAGAGLYVSPGSSLLTKLFPNTGRALGIHEVGAQTAGLVAPVAAAAVAVRYGWRPAMLATLVVSIPVFVLVVWRVRPTEPEHSDTSLHERFDPALVADLLSRPGVLFTMFLATVGFFHWQSFLSFFPTFLIEHAGLDSQRASLVFGSTFVLGVVAAPSLGGLSDRFGRDSMIAAAFVSTVVGYALFIVVGRGLPTFLVGAAALGVGAGFWPPVASRFMDDFSDEERGSGFGLVRTVLLLCSSTGSAVTGTLAETAGWPAAYGVVAGLLALAVTAVTVNRAFRLGL